MDSDKNSFLMLGIAGWRSEPHQGPKSQNFACGAHSYTVVRWVSCASRQLQRQHTRTSHCLLC